MERTLLGRFKPSARGAILLVIGISIFGFADNLTLLVSQNVSVGQFHFSRSVIAGIMVFGVAKLFGISVVPRYWKPIIIRTGFMVTSMLLYFGAMPMMPIAEAGAGLFTSPIFVLILSSIIFGEKVGWEQVLAVAVGSFGVLLVLQPGSNGLSVFQLMPIMAGACYAAGSIITYRFLQEESSFAILISFIMAIGLSGALITSGLTIFPVSSMLLKTAPFLFLGWQSVDELYWVRLFVIAACATAALSLMTRAYQLTRTSYAAVFEYSYLISVGFFSWIFWGIVPNFLSIIGIVLIVISGIIITLAQRKK